MLLVIIWMLVEHKAIYPYYIIANVMIYTASVELTWVFILLTVPIAVTYLELWTVTISPNSGNLGKSNLSSVMSTSSIIKLVEIWWNFLLNLTIIDYSFDSVITPVNILQLDNR